VNLTEASPIHCGATAGGSPLENHAADRAFRIGQKRNVLVSQVSFAGRTVRKDRRDYRVKRWAGEGPASDGSGEQLADGDEAIRELLNISGFLGRESGRWIHSFRHKGAHFMSCLRADMDSSLRQRREAPI